MGGNNSYKSYVDGFALRGVDGENQFILLLVELDGLDVIEDAEQMGLDGVRVRGLAQNFQQSWV